MQVRCNLVISLLSEKLDNIIVYASQDQVHVTTGAHGVGASVLQAEIQVLSGGHILRWRP